VGRTFVTFAALFSLSLFASACQSDNNHTDGCVAAAARCDGSANDGNSMDAGDGGETSDAGDGSVAIPTLAVPGRIHLVNRGAVDVYLGLRFVDRCAFDYTLRGPDGAADAGAPVVIEQPMCPCHPACDGCGASCATQNCTELCDTTPPRIAANEEYVLTWDGRTFGYVMVCGGARCAEAATAPAGIYNLTVPLFDRAVAPDSGVAAARTVETAFQISSGGTGDADIEIAIGL
jgi:hypothetical protein